MAAQESNVRAGTGILTFLQILVGLASLAVIGLIALSTLQTTPITDLLTLPTSAVVKPAAQPRAPAQPAAVPVQPAIDAYNATAEAQYAEAIQAAPVPNVGQSEPVVISSRPSDRQPAGENVPTAEPVQVGAPVVNIQETHQCKHGQTWTDAGCKNPTSTKGSKVKP